MKYLFAATFPLLLCAGTLKEDVKLYLDADTLNAADGVKRISSSIRLRPGKFGNAYLIERRTKNEAVPAEIILGDGATLTGKSNLLKLPADGFAALPQTSIKPDTPNCLSFRYRGSGKISVTLDQGEESVPLGELTASDRFRNASFTVVPKSDTLTLKLRSTGAVELDRLMFDRGIPHANTYHAPGTWRNVDVIDVDPSRFDNRSGAFACWIKAPWFAPDGVGTGNALICVAAEPKMRKKFGDNLIKSITIWGNRERNGKYEVTLYDVNRDEKGRGVGPAFRLSELRDAPADGWNHIVFNWKMAGDRLETEIILNGKQKFTRNAPFIPRKPACEMTIGYSGGGYVNGMLDDIALFRRPLTAAEIGTIVKSGKPLRDLMK